MSTWLYFILGALITFHVTKLVLFLRLYLRPSSLPRYLHAPGGQDAWALVTGASDGIGRGFATELCERGFNVVLHGRNTTKLNGVKEDLLQEFPERKIEITVADASRSDAAISDIKSTVEKLNGPLTVLVNNVGGLPGDLYQTFESQDVEKINAIINTNARFMADLTRTLLPILLQSPPALILNIGSMSSEVSTPYLTVYAGAKAFDFAFSAALKAELRAEEKDIEVLCIQVASVQSNGNKAELNLFTPTSRRMAVAALERVGCGRRVVVGYFMHALQLAFMNVLPEQWAEAAVISAMRARKEKEAKGQ
ncbi:hypothetical protein MMC08_006325 [Hypocenomyce scalaris]|nr:hypothetical protein [Hypocenomyce scalaris]